MFRVGNSRWGLWVPEPRAAECPLRGKILPEPFRLKRSIMPPTKKETRGGMSCTDKRIINK